MSTTSNLRPLLLALQCIVLVCLAGCGVSSTEELRTWLEKERKLLGAAATAFAPPRTFEPEAYALAGQADPFSSARLNGVDLQPPGASHTATKPSAYALEFSGSKQELENFPLENLQVKGTLSQEGVRVALILAGDRLHQVHKGDYMGLRKGKVMDISATAIVLRELEQDASGQWKAKTTVLPLKEGEK